MANWCNTTIILKADNEKTAKKIYKYFKTLTNRIEHDPQEGWWGIVLVDLGFPKEEIDHLRNRGIRGFVTDVELYETEVVIFSEDAWFPQLDALRLYILSLEDESITLSYHSDEPCLGVFQYYGDYNDRYMTDIVVPENEYFHEHRDIDYFRTKKEVEEFLTHIVKFPFMDAEECVEMANELIDQEGYPGDAYFAFHAYEEVSPAQLSGCSDELLRKFLKERKIYKLEEK